MFRRSTVAAANQTRWLAELNETLDQARRLVKCVGAADGRMDAILLYTRIETIRLEVQAMRMRAGDGGFDPERIELPPWHNEFEARG